MADAKIYRASTTAPVNIAVIKLLPPPPPPSIHSNPPANQLFPNTRYWGKRDPTLNLPTNSSLSVTLSQSDLRTHTTASCSPDYPAGDTLLLNGSPQPLTTLRSLACLSSLRVLRAALESANPALPPLSTYPLRLVSRNNFPTAAGLASSAAGFAALVRAVADLYALPQSATQLSLIARQGSGSACRSLLGGYVAWDRGERGDGLDSAARLVAGREHWPEMRALVLVVSADKKGVSSTAGMQTTVQTSSLFGTRATVVVPARMAEMESAVRARDFDAFARITMCESNGFHATCLDTEPPIFYLNDVSRAAIRAVEGINARAAAGGGRRVAAYTFDAGPNAVIYYLEQDRDKVLGSFKTVLGHKEGWDGERGRAVVPADVDAAADRDMEVLREGVRKVILTSVGDGPISVQDHLVDEQGKPVET